MMSVGFRPLPEIFFIASSKRLGSDDMSKAIDEVLLDAILPDLEVFLLHVGYELSVVVACDHVGGDEVDARHEVRLAILVSRLGGRTGLLGRRRRDLLGQRRRRGLRLRMGLDAGGQRHQRAQDERAHRNSRPSHAAIISRAASRGTNRVTSGTRDLRALFGALSEVRRLATAASAAPSTTPL